MTTDTPATFHPNVDLACSPMMLKTVQSELDVAGGRGPFALASARIAFEEIYASYAALEDAVAAARKAAPQARLDSHHRPKEGAVQRGPDGRMFAPHGREWEISQGAEASLARVLPRVEKQVADILGSMNRAADKIGEVLKATASQALQQETRRFMLILPAEERFTFLTDRIQSRDLETVASILAQPAFLSGLTDQQRETARNMATQQFCPAEAREVDLLGKTFDIVLRARDVYKARMEKAIADGQKAGPRARGDADAKIDALMGKRVAV